jgi:hypothetical protein
MASSSSSILKDIIVLVIIAVVAYIVFKIILNMLFSPLFWFILIAIVAGYILARMGVFRKRG